MKMLRYFLLFLFASVLALEVEDPRHLSTKELLAYTNEVRTKKPYQTFDFNNKIFPEEMKKLDKLGEYISSKYKIYPYIIFIKNVNDEFNLDEFVSKFPFNSDKNRSMLVLTYDTLKLWTFIPGEEIKSIYTESVLKSIKHHLAVVNSNYDNARELIKRLINPFIVPEEKWTPKSLADYFNNKYLKEKGKTIEQIDYAYVDPIYISEIDTFDSVKKYFEDLKRKEVKTFFFIIEDTNEAYDGITLANFTNELAGNLTNNKDVLKKSIVLVYSLDLENLYFYAGKDLGKIDDRDKFIITFTGHYWHDLKLSFKNVMKAMRNYVAGENLGWQASMLFDYLQEDDEIYSNHYLYVNDKTQFTVHEKAIMKEILEELSENNVNAYIFVMNKIDDKLYLENGKKSLNLFHKDLVDNYVRKIIHNVNEVIFYYSKTDDNQVELKIGNNITSFFSKEIEKDVKENLQKLAKSNARLYEVLIYLLRALRYHRILKGKKLTPKIFSSYFNDINNCPDYIFYDPKETVFKKNDTETIKKVEQILKDINETKVSTYFLVFDKINRDLYQTNESLNLFMDELGKNLSENYNPTNNISDHLLLVAYFKQFHTFKFYKAECAFKLKDDNFQRIKDKFDNMPDFEKDLKQSVLDLLKLLRYYIYLVGKEWKGSTYAEVLYDLEGEPTSVLFDPEGSLDARKKRYLESFLKEISDVFDYHIYWFINLFDDHSSLNRRILEKNPKPNLIKSLVENIKLPSNVLLNKTCVIIYNITNSKFEYYFGDTIKILIAEREFDDTLKRTCNEDLNAGMFQGFKCVIKNIRNKLYGGKQIAWNPQKLSQFFINYFNIDKKTEKDNLLFDYYFQLTEKEEEKIVDYLQNFSNYNNTNTYVTVLNEIDINCDPDTFLIELYKQLFHLFIKSNRRILLILYSSEDKILQIYPGSGLQNILTLNNMQFITSQTLPEIKSNLYKGLMGMLKSIKEAYEVIENWKVNDIVDAVRTKYFEAYYLLFDPNNNLNDKEHNKLVQIMKLLMRNQIYVYTLILPKLSNEYKNEADFLKELSNSFPLPAEFQNDFIIFVLITTEFNNEKFAIRALNDKNHLLSDSKKEDIVEQVREKFLEEKAGLFKSLEFGLRQVSHIVLDKYNYAKSSIFITSISLISFCFIIIAIFFLNKFMIRKKTRSNEIDFQMKKPIVEVVDENEDKTATDIL